MILLSKEQIRESNLSSVFGTLQRNDIQGVIVSPCINNAGILGASTTRVYKHHLDISETYCFINYVGFASTMRAIPATNFRHRPCYYKGP